MIITPVTRITLSKSCVERLLRFARDQPIEAPAIVLGYLTEENDQKYVCAEEIVFTENAEKSPTRFSIDAEILYAIYRYAEQTRKEIIAIFHSHPTVSSEKRLRPSSTDKQFMKLNPCVWIIAGKLQTSEAILKAYQMAKDTIHEVEITVTE